MPFDISLLGKPFPTRTVTYDARRPSLHALACGAGPDDLDLLLDSRGPKVLASFPVVLAFEAMTEAMLALGGNLITLLHGAQKHVVHRPLPPEADVQVTACVRALYDKGKGALAIFGVTGVEKGQPLFELESQIFYRGEGGFGGERGPEAPAHAPPEGKSPDKQILSITRPEQALLYRLASGDTNPLHVEPEIAALAGFARPILHGLCTFGFAERAVEAALCGGDPERVASIEGRFARPVFPGETIAVDVWRMGDGEARFMAGVKERGEPAITLGRVTFRR